MDLQKKYELINSNNRAILSSSTHFGFGKEAIYFSDNLKAGKSYARGNNTNFLPPNKLELTAGMGEYEYFDSIDIEVFKVE